MSLRFPADFIEERVDTTFAKYSMHNRWFGSISAFKSMTKLKKLSICATDIEGTLEDLPPSTDIDDFNYGPLIYSDKNKTGSKRKVDRIFELWKANKEMKRKGEKQSRNDDEGYISDNSSSNSNTYSWDTYNSDYSEPSSKYDYRHYAITHQDLKGNIVWWLKEPQNFECWRQSTKWSSR